MNNIVGPTFRELVTLSIPGGSRVHVAPPTNQKLLYYYSVVEFENMMVVEVFFR